MRAHRLTLSKLGLAHQCLWGFRPDVVPFPRLAGDAAQLGSLVHSLAESRVNKTPLGPHDITMLARAKEISDGPLAGFLDSVAWTICERGYLYDANSDSAAEGPRRGEAGYDDVASFGIRGTVDLVHIDGDSARVVDIKTGKPPIDAEQLYGQAVCVSRTHKVKTVKVEYARALKTKLDLLNTETLDEDRLDAEAGRIGRLLRLLPTAEPNPGDHCWRCDAWSVCPVKKDARDRYVPEPDSITAARLYDESIALF